MTPGVRHVRPAEFTPGHATPGMRREEAVASEAVWSGVVHTDPGSISGWHHHGDHETVAYVVSGRFRLEHGAHGRDVVDAGPGEFVYIPPRAVHRESNPSGEQATVVLVRAGSGEVVVNVDGPEAPT